MRSPTSTPANVRSSTAVLRVDAVADLRRGAHRLLLVIAGVFDILLAVALGGFTGALFGWFGAGVPGSPLVWRCVAVVEAGFGLLYLHAARRMDRARLIAAIGLLAKVLAPAVLAAIAVQGRGEVVGRMLPLVVLSTLVWWIPFAALVLEGVRGAARIRAASPLVCAGLHALAGVTMLLVLRGGTEAEPSLATRMAYVGAHTAGWRAGFGVWMAAGMSVMALYAWWAPAVRNSRLALAALVVAGAGLACDLSGEAVYVGWMPLLTGDPAAFDHAQRVGTVLTAVFANGFYTAAGILLTVGTPALPRAVRALAWVAWGAGIALSVCGAAGWATGLMAASGVLFPALVLLALALCRVLR